MNDEKVLLTPGNYSETEKADADSRRSEFDLKNDQVFYSGIPVDLEFAGDSITHFMEENRFYRKYGFVINRGIGGDTAHVMAWRFKADVTQLHPRLCVMLIGCNNLWVLENSIDKETGDYTEESKQAVLKQIEDSYRSMLEEARRNGIALWICSVLPQGKDVGNSSIRNPFIVRVNKMLEGLAEEYKTEYVDYFHALTKEDGLTMLDGISREGIHPKNKGYELMRQVLEPKLDKFFEKNSLDK